MKTNKFLKVSLLILSFALILGAMFAMSINAEGEEATAPVIVSQNVKYTDQFQLMFAVTADPTATSVTLRVYEEDPRNVAGDAVVPSFTLESATSGEASGLGEEAYIFTIGGVWATDMAKEFYVQAEANGQKSEIKKYSIAEYLYERLASQRFTSDVQKNFYLNTIAFGATAQKALGTEGTLLSDYSYLIVDGEVRGIAPVGRKITPYVDAISADWDIITTDADGNSTTAENQVGGFTIPEDAVKTVATAKNKVAFRKGVDNLEKATVSAAYTTVSQNETSADGKFKAFNSYCNFKYEYDDERGIVAKLAINAAGQQMRIEVNNTDVTADDATAFECSFDLKMHMVDPADPTDKYMRWWMNDADSRKIGEANVYGHTLPSGATEYTTTGLYAHRTQGAGSMISTDVDTRDWFHLSLVVYKSQPNTTYIYINGVKAEKTIALSTSLYNGDITTLAGAIVMHYNVPGSWIYVDNIFCGLTTDTLS